MPFHSINRIFACAVGLGVMLAAAGCAPTDWTLPTVTPGPGRPPTPQPTIAPTDVLIPAADLVSNNKDVIVGFMDEARSMCGALINRGGSGATSTAASTQLDELTAHLVSTYPAIVLVDGRIEDHRPQSIKQVILFSQTGEPLLSFQATATSRETWGAYTVDISTGVAADLTGHRRTAAEIEAGEKLPGVCAGWSLDVSFRLRQVELNAPRS